MESSPQGEVVGRESQKPGRSVDTDMEEAQGAASSGSRLGVLGALASAPLLEDGVKTKRITQPLDWSVQQDLGCLRGGVNLTNDFANVCHRVLVYCPTVALGGC